MHDSECPEIGPICQVRDEPPQQHHTFLWLTEARLLGEYGLLPALALQGSLPFRLVSTTTRYTDLSGNPIQLDYENIHHRDETLVGIGDAQLLLHHGRWVGPLRLGVRGGLSLPTGKVQPNPFRLGDLGLPHEHLQFGTGTFDPVLAVDVSNDFGAWSISAFALAQAPLYQGREGYQAGARIFGGAVASSGLGLSGPSFRVGLMGLHEFAERWDGVVPSDDGNQGRTDLYLGPGITFPFAQDWSVSVDLRARVWGHAVNAQLDLPFVVELGIGRLLHLEQGAHEDEERGHDEHEPAGDVQDVVSHGEAVALAPVPGKLTVFDFWAPWCEACKPLDARLRALAASDERVALRRVNVVDFDSPIAAQELPGVSALPYARIVAGDGRVVWQGSGSPEEIMRRVRDARE